MILDLLPQVLFFQYVVIAALGYSMFGDAIMGEVTQNLPLVPSYNHVLTKTTIWLMAINPATKYALTMNPINLNTELVVYHFIPSLEVYHFLVRLLFRTLMSMIILIVSILIPQVSLSLRAYVCAMQAIVHLLTPSVYIYFATRFQFHTVMALLGSLFAFTISVVFPCICHLRLNKDAISKGETTLCYVLIIFGAVIGSIGTVWAFLPL